MAKVIHTCTGCVPIDASIIEVYTRLIATEERANEAAEHAEAAAGKAPYIGENGNWWEWDSELEQFVDTGVPASGGGGSDPNAVRYTPQSLTPSQAEQARQNISAASTASVSAKQDTLVSGTNIKTVNNQSLLGSGNIVIEGGSGSDPDAVKYTEQSLTDAQKAQARLNIGAGTSNFTGNPIVSLAAPATPDGTLIATLSNGDTVTIDLNHNHPQYPKYEYLEDESDMPATPDEDTLYLIAEESE